MNTLYQNAHSPKRVPVNALHNRDVPLVVIGAIIALVLGAPAVGVIVGGAGWLLQRVVQVTDRRFTRKLRDPVKQVGINVTESFVRIWLLAGAIVVSGVVGGRKDLAEAIAFAAEGKIRVQIGKAPLADINKIFAGLRAGTVSGRMVMML